MTVSTTTRKAGPFTGNGVTTVFPFTFKVFAKADLLVVHTDAAGAESVLELDSDYSVTLNADQDNNPGGSVTYSYGGTPLSASERLTILSNVALLQPTDIQNRGGFHPAVIENALDRVTILAQQAKELLDRAIVFAPSDTASSTQLPAAADRANKALVFDDDGDIAVSTTGWQIEVTSGTALKTTFVAGVDFTAGVSTTLTLPSNPLSKANLTVLFDSAAQQQTEWEISGATLTFDSAIPADVAQVECTYVIPLSLGYVGAGTIYDANVAAAAAIDANKLNFVQIGVSASPRSVRTKLREFVSAADYEDLVTTVAAKDPGDAASHIAASFDSWRAAIQAALDAVNARGGGTVLIPAKSTSYLIDDYITVYDNTRVVFETEVQLADYTTVGGILLIDGDNVEIVNPMINGSEIYAGASGQNGIATLSGTNVNVIGGYVKNCARGTTGAKDGGKAFQFESTYSDVVVNGTAIENCFMAMSAQHDFVDTDPCGPLLFTNITARDCPILFFVRQANGEDTTGQEHSVALTNFIAKNCGTHEGVIQLSRAANVLVSNGHVTNSTSIEALIRGNHRFCRFENLQFVGDCDALIDLDPSEYAIDSSYALENNNYDIFHSGGAANYVAWADPTTANRILSDCQIRAHLQEDVVTKIIGDELRNGYCRVELQHANKSVIATTATLYLESRTNFATFPVGVCIPRVNTGQLAFPSAQVPSTDPNTLDDYQEGTWTPIDSSAGGLSFTAGYGDYIKVGRMVLASFRVTYPVTANTANTLIGGLPFASINTAGRVVCGLAPRYTDQGAVLTGANNPGTTTFSLALPTGVLATNANMSGKTLDALLIYFTAD